MSGTRSNFSKSHICQCLTRLTTLRRHHNVTISSSRRQTTEDFVKGIVNLASGLIHLGIKPGNVVAISAFNSDLYLEWLLAVTYVGGIVGPFNYRWSFEESRFALELVQPVMLVTDNSCQWSSELFKDSVSSCKWRVFIGSSRAVSDTVVENVLTPELLKRPRAKAMSFDYLWAPKDVAIICFTSGTTGRPKGVTISHTSLIIQSLAKIAVVGYNEDDVYLHTAPLCHIGGISSALAMLMAGGCHVFIPKFEAKFAVEAIEQHGVTSFITVPTIIADLVEAIRLKKDWKGSKTVKKILNGGGSLSSELFKDASKFFPNAKIFSAYGMTETCSSMTFLSLRDPTSGNQDHPTHEFKPKIHQEGGICVGKPAPHVEIKINNKDSFGVGKICTRGTHVMIQYWNQTTTTTSTSTSNHDLENWLDTGDIGKIDHHGNLWLMGRDKGRIKSGGENIYPEEVEAVLSQHPGITGVVVVGLAHPRLTEVVVTCLQLEKDWKWTNDLECKELCLSSQILKQYCRKKNLSGYKIPRFFMVMRKPFPRTSTGKLRREEVRREAELYLQLFRSNL